MLFLSTALYLEAKPLIHLFSLKQNHAHTRYSIFQNDTVVLIITGSGQLRSCAAITYLCMSYPITEQDLLINFGLCAGLCKATYGNTYFIHKLTHNKLGHSLYPDPLLFFDYPEASLLTFDLPVTKEVNENETVLGDMEGYSIMFAAQNFFLPHQMIFLKVVSDLAGSSETVTLSPKKVESLLNDSATQLFTYINTLDNHSFFFKSKRTIMQEDISLLLDEVSKALFYTETMKHSMQQYFQYYALTHDDITEKVHTWLRTSNALSCHQKKEGKQYDRALKKWLLES